MGNNILLMYLFASIAPSVFYTWTYTIVRIIGITTIFNRIPLLQIQKDLITLLFDSYFNWYSWGIIALIAIIHPLAQISLWLLFQPFAHVIEAELRVDVAAQHQPRGNWRPVQHEHSYEITQVSGKVPEDLNGVFLRNGPNAKYT